MIHMTSSNSNLDNNRAGRDFLFEGAIWQETLLQSYRSFHLTLQSILLATGIGLLVMLVTNDDCSRQWRIIVIAGLIFVFALVQTFVTSGIRKTVVERGDDISYWHRGIISDENTLPGDMRHFTHFKIHQQARRENVSHLESLVDNNNPLAPEDINTLIGKGIGQTRLVVDKILFRWISVVWVIILVADIATYAILCINPFAR